MDNDDVRSETVMMRNEQRTALRKKIVAFTVRGLQDLKRFHL